MPSLLEKWMEDVFTYGFAYGSKGKALNDKKFTISITIGADSSFYGTEIPITVAKIALPAMPTAIYTGMDFIAQEANSEVSNLPQLDEKTKEEY